MGIPNLPSIIILVCKAEKWFTQFYSEENVVYQRRLGKGLAGMKTQLFNFNASFSLAATLSQFRILNNVSTKSVRLFLYFK